MPRSWISRQSEHLHNFCHQRVAIVDRINEWLLLRLLLPGTYITFKGKQHFQLDISSPRSGLRKGIHLCLKKIHAQKKHRSIWTNKTDRQQDGQPNEHVFYIDPYAAYLSEKWNTCGNTQSQNIWHSSSVSKLHFLISIPFSKHLLRTILILTAGFLQLGL